jgi:hypothetical protein
MAAFFTSSLGSLEMSCRKRESVVRYGERGMRAACGLGERHNLRESPPSKSERRCAEAARDPLVKRGYFGERKRIEGKIESERKRKRRREKKNQRKKKRHRGEQESESSVPCR